MFVNDIETLPENYRLEKILQVLNKQYGVNIDFESSEEFLKDSYETNKNIKNKVIQESKFNSYHSNEEYVKATLIMEAIKIYLVEIAPKRKRRR